jgi:hypothetical protein
VSDILLVLSNAVEGRDVDFDHWYSTIHIPEILELSSFVSAERYRLDAAVPNRTDHRHLAIYEVTGTKEAFDELAAARPSLTVSETLDSDRVIQGYYRENPGP